MMAYLPGENPRGVWENRGALQDEETLRLLTEAATLAHAGQSSIARAAASSADAKGRETPPLSFGAYLASNYSKSLGAYLNSSGGGTPTGPPSARPSTSTAAREKESRANDAFEHQLAAMQQHAKFEREYNEAKKAWRERYAEAEAPSSILDWYRQPEWPYPASEAVGTTHDAAPQQPEPPFPNLTPEQGT